MTPKQIKTAMKRAADKSGMSYREISMKAGLGEAYLWQWMNSNHEPQIDKLVAVADVLGIAISLNNAKSHGSKK